MPQLTLFAGEDVERHATDDGIAGLVGFLDPFDFALEHFLNAFGGGIENPRHVPSHGESIEHVIDGRSGGGVDVAVVGGNSHAPERATMRCGLLVLLVRQANFCPPAQQSADQLHRPGGRMLLVVDGSVEVEKHRVKGVEVDRHGGESREADIGAKP